MTISNIVIGGICEEKAVTIVKGVHAFIYSYFRGGGGTMRQDISTRLKSKVFSLEIPILLIWTNVPKTNITWTDVG